MYNRVAGEGSGFEESKRMKSYEIWPSFARENEASLCERRNVAAVRVAGSNGPIENLYLSKGHYLLIYMGVLWLFLRDCAVISRHRESCLALCTRTSGRFAAFLLLLDDDGHICG